MGSMFQNIENPKSDLQQGDLIDKSEGLLGVMKNVHRYFCDEKNLGFIVLTQSCDLMRERGDGDPCKTPYIELAVIRNLKPVLYRYTKPKDRVVEGVFLEEARGRISELIVRIINQNEGGHGLFYLHPYGDAGLGNPSVALLRVSIALKAKAHYEMLIGARRGRLSVEFQNKLGWMIGNLYSRAATTDFPELYGKAEESDLKKRLTASTPGVGPYWVSEAALKAARTQVPPLQLEGSAEEVYKQLTRLPVQKIKDQAVAEILAVLTQSEVVLEPQKMKVVEANLRNSAVFGSLLKNK